MSNRDKLTDTAEQQREGEDYNSWKRLVKRRPIPNDTLTIELLWNEALTILNGGDREWKQFLPRDLDADDNYGRDHIYTIMSMQSYSGGSGAFITLARPFRHWERKLSN